MLALVVLAIAVVGTASFFYANRRNLQNARIKRTATWAVLEKMEEYRGLPYSNLADGTFEDEVELGDITADRKATIATITEGAVTYKQLVVELSWDSQTVALTTYLSN